MKTKALTKGQLEWYKNNPGHEMFQPGKIITVAETDETILDLRIYQNKVNRKKGYNYLKAFAIDDKTGLHYSILPVGSGRQFHSPGMHYVITPVEFTSNPNSAIGTGALFSVIKSNDK